MFSDWSGRRVAVVGLGTENTPLAKFLAQRGARVTGVDKRPLDRLPTAPELTESNVRLVTGRDNYLQVLLDETFDYVFLTPGMVKDLPEVAAAREAGAVISTQVNLFFHLCKAPIIGITGTSGKSTTTTLIGKILAASAQRPVYVGGNLNEPLIDRVEQIPRDAWVVLELSSFQLELAESSPHLAVLLNIFPNHLDIHPSLAAYRAAKENIFRFQRPERGDVALFNFDDPDLRSLSASVPAGHSFFGRSADLTDGATVEDDWLVVKRSHRRVPVMPLQEIQLPGPHNVNNVLAAVNVADLCGVPPQVIREVVAGFKGLEHRLEVVAERDGVLFVNDSIATTPDRAAAALRSFSRPIVLMAGGSDKGITYDELAEAILSAPMRVLVLLGATADAIEAQVEQTAQARGCDVPPIIRADSFATAVRAAADQAQPGDVVLLSPGCASFDMFPNYMERGKRFRELVTASAD